MPKTSLITDLIPLFYKEKRQTSNIIGVCLQSETIADCLNNLLHNHNDKDSAQSLIKDSEMSLASAVKAVTVSSLTADGISTNVPT